MVPPSQGDESVPRSAVDGAQRNDGGSVPGGWVTRDWEELPGPVRGRLAELAAAALADVRPSDVPSQLRPVMRFAPAKRAKLGASALVTALHQSTVFRTAVVDWCRANRPAALDVDNGDPVVVAAAALLLDDTTRATHCVELVAYRVEQGQLRSERDSAVAKADRLSAELSRLREKLEESERRAERAGEESGAEADRLRKRLREQGVRLKEAKDEAHSAKEDLERVRQEAERSKAELTQRLGRERERAREQREHAERAKADAEVARHSAREARQGDEVRLALLLETIEGALGGLRRELGATGLAGPRPADAVRQGRARPGTTGGAVDLAALDRLLALPAVHLIVDGYNVTKTGYPELPLADQRDRLAHQLAALASRTGAEVTVVFDGADVLSVPSTGPRGVRVLFSEPGVQADDVIRTLVEAEPHGRQLVVATSDRAVVASVHQRGAFTVPSSVLLARINRV